MTLPVLGIIGGIILLFWGAAWFVDGAAILAKLLGVPPLIIGLTIVGMGTSLPELLVSAMAASQGNAGLGIGNAIGSNITNIGLVVGATALMTPLKVHSRILIRELPVLILALGLGWLLLANGRFDRWEGIVLLIALLAVMIWMIVTAKQAPPGEILEKNIHIRPERSKPRAAGLFLIGLSVLLLASKLLVWGSVAIAHHLGISGLVIGLTVVAVGTSLPELAASLLSAHRGEPDIALGNVVGSNLFNVLGVMALPGIIAPGPLSPEVMHRDYPIMFGMTLLLFAFAWGGGQPRKITRFEGGLLLLFFLTYQLWIYYSP